MSKEEPLGRRNQRKRTMQNDSLYIVKKKSLWEVYAPCSLLPLNQKLQGQGKNLLFSSGSLPQVALKEEKECSRLLTFFICTVSCHSFSLQEPARVERDHMS